MPQFPQSNLIHPHRDEQPASFNILPKLINGGIAGIISTFLMFPFDLAKTRIQKNQQHMTMTGCFRNILKTEGFKGLYRGLAVNVILIAPEKAVKLATNDYMRYYLKPKDKPLPFTMELLAGGTAGLLQNVLTTPMDLLKIRLQVERRIAEANSVKRLTARQLTKDLIREKGIIGLYKGIGPSNYRNVLFSVVYFPAFFYLNDIGPRKDGNPKEAKSYWSFISGCLAGAFAAATVTPFDVIKTRIQWGGDLHYSGTLDAFVKIWKHEGPLVLTRGTGIRMMVIAPLFGILQVVYYLGVGEYLIAVAQK